MSAMSKYVYVVACYDDKVEPDDLVAYYKIGITGCPLSRLKNLQGSNPLHLEMIHCVDVGPAAGKLEAAILKKLSKHRLNGEWITEEGYTQISAWFQDAEAFPDKFDPVQELHDFIDQG